MNIIDLVVMQDLRGVKMSSKVIKRIIKPLDIAVKHKEYKKPK